MDKLHLVVNAINEQIEGARITESRTGEIWKHEAMDILHILISAIHRKVEKAKLAVYLTSRDCESWGEQYDLDLHTEAIIDLAEAELIRDYVFSIVY